MINLFRKHKTGRTVMFKIVKTLQCKFLIMIIMYLAVVSLMFGYLHADNAESGVASLEVTEKIQKSAVSDDDKKMEDPEFETHSEQADKRIDESENPEDEEFEIPMFMEEDPMFTWKEFDNTEDNPIFKHGEILVYDVSWMGINAGTIRMELTPEVEHNGKTLHKAVVTGETNRAFSLFFKVRDVITSFFDPQTFNSVFYTKNIREGRYRKYLETTYDQEKRIAVADDETFDLPPNSKDPVVCIYALRRYQPQENIAIRMNSNSDGKDNFPVKIGLETVETVRLRDGMPRPAIRARPLPTWEGRVFEKRDSEVTLWLSNDVYAVPLRLETKVRIGTLRGELISRTGPGWELNPEIRR